MTIRWAVSGLVVLGGLTGFVLVSHGYGSPRLHLPFYVLAAVVHLVAVLASRKVADSRSGLLFVIGLAFMLRAVVCLTPESREGDYYRYMWDGALAAHGISPYRFSPAEIIRGEVQSPEIRRLSQDGHRVLTRINHPELRTLYPPVAQSLFAVGYLIGPFNSTAWRAVLLLLEVAAGVMILLMLRSAKLPLAWSVAYLWNPLLIVESYHYRHLDLALAPFLLLLLFGVWKNRPYVAAVGLAAATAVKIWPLLLFPFLAIRFRDERRLLIKTTLAFAILVALLFIPYWSSIRTAPSSGTIAYAKTWYANQLAFDAIQPVGARLARASGYAIDGRVVSRAILLMLLVGAALWLALRTRGNRIGSHALAFSTVVLLMVAAGPTVYPWYFLPAVVFSPFVKRPAFLFWAPLLILTYLSRSVPNPFWLLAMVHVPAWLILILQVRDLYRAGVDENA